MHARVHMRAQQKSTALIAPCRLAYKRRDDATSWSFAAFSLRESVSTSLENALAVDLEQPGAALAAADAHRHHAPLRLATTSFLQQMAGETRTGHAEGMTDRDRA